MKSALQRGDLMRRSLRILSLISLLFASEGMAIEEEFDEGPSFDVDGPFDITQLPKGASVTLPSPATTLVPVSLFYRVGPTDRAQVFRLSAPNTDCAVRIQVYDKTSDEVKTSMLRGGESMVYRFERLNGVRVHAAPIDNCKSMPRLVLDSNRPLEIGM